MLKFAAQGIAPRIVAGLAGSTQGSCQHVNLGVGAALQKCISQGHCYNRKVVVTNHYEFDQKVSETFKSAHISIIMQSTYFLTDN